jgi:hypothetical protein
MLRRVALVRTDVSEELRASFIRVTRIGELGTTLAVTSNYSTLRIIKHYMRKEGIEWDVPHHGRKRELLATVSISSCVSISVEIWLFGRCFATNVWRILSLWEVSTMA